MKNRRMKKSIVIALGILIIMSSCAKKNNDKKDFSDCIKKLNGYFFVYKSSKSRVYTIDTLTNLAIDSNSIANDYWQFVGNTMTIDTKEQNDSVVINIIGEVSYASSPISYVQNWTYFYRMQKDLPQSNIGQSTFSFGFSWYPDFTNFADTNLSMTYPSNMVHNPMATFNYYPETDSVFINYFLSVPDYTPTHKIKDIVYSNLRYGGKFIR